MKNSHQISESEFLRQVAEATQLGEEELRTQPWAASVRFDRRARRIVVTLNKGTILSVPANLIPEVEQLTDDDLAKVAVLPPGFYIDWEPQDIQVSVAWLLTGLYGTQAVMPAIGRRRGSVNSKAKTTAVRAIGAKGGRPPKKQSQVIRTKRVKVR